jgi:hypothetical protein
VTTAEAQAKRSSAAPAATTSVPAKAAGSADINAEDDRFDPEASVIRLHSPHYAVAGFVKTSLRFLIPVELWGGEENMRCCFKHIDRFVRLRRFENFSLKEATHGLKSRNFPPKSASVLPVDGSEKNQNLNAGRKSSVVDATAGRTARATGPTEHPNRLALRQRMLDDWIYWIFIQLVVPLSAITTILHFEHTCIDFVSSAY